MNRSAINRNKYFKVTNLIYEKRELENSVLINIMCCFESMASEMLKLRFKIFENKNRQKYVIITLIRRTNFFKLILMILMKELRSLMNWR